MDWNNLDWVSLAVFGDFQLKNEESRIPKGMCVVKSEWYKPRSHMEIFLSEEIDYLLFTTQGTGDYIRCYKKCGCYASFELHLTAFYKFVYI